MEAGLWPEVQWAAVSTSVGEMRLPPQKGREPELDNSPTCHGYSLEEAVWPPTIFWSFLPPFPHSQVEGCADVA